jgi:hypothetical protein
MTGAGGSTSGYFDWLEPSGGADRGPARHHLEQRPAMKDHSGPGGVPVAIQLPATSATVRPSRPTCTVAQGAVRSVMAWRGAAMRASANVQSVLRTTNARRHELPLQVNRSQEICGRSRIAKDRPTLISGTKPTTRGPGATVNRYAYPGNVRGQ